MFWKCGHSFHVKPETGVLCITGTWPKPETVLNCVRELLITNLDRLSVMLNNFTISFQVLAYSPFMTIFHLTVVSSCNVAQLLRVISSGLWTSGASFFRDQAAECSPPCCFKATKNAWNLTCGFLLRCLVTSVGLSFDDDEFYTCSGITEHKVSSEDISVMETISEHSIL